MSQSAALVKLKEKVLARGERLKGHVKAEGKGFVGEDAPEVLDVFVEELKVLIPGPWDDALLESAKQGAIVKLKALAEEI